MLLLLIFTVLVEGALASYFFNHFLLFILVLEILFPIFIFICLKIIEIPVFFTKIAIVKKAEKKIKGLAELTTIGIAGSYGKTSTKEILYFLLSEKYNVLKTEANINTQMGVAKTALNFLGEKHKFFICEMAAYKKGEIKSISDIVKPKIGILTGVNEQHLALFGSQENIIKGKYELIESLPSDGLAIFNGNNKYCLELYRKTKKNNKLQKVICTTISTAVEIAVQKEKDIWAENIMVEKEFIRFRAVSKDGDFAEFKVNLLGRQNIENILLAAACARELGMSLDEISKICLKIKPELGGIKFLKKENPVILDSSYSANPTGVMADLDYLKIYPEKKIIIMPCLIELGESSREIHKKIGRKIGEICDLAIITTKERFNEIKKGALEAGMKEENILFIRESNEIAEKVKSYTMKSVVLLEGRTPKGLINLLCDNIS